MIADPVASMEVWAIEFELGGRVFTIPPMPASEWWPILAEGDLSALLDVATSEPPDALEELILDGEVSQKEIGEKLVAAVEEATGRTLHSAIVLVAAASTNWAAIHGYLAVRGFRWDGLPIGAALDAIYVSILNHLDKEGIEKFQKVLDTDTGGRPTEKKRAELEDEFAAMAGPRPTGGAKATAGPSGSGRPRTPRRPRQPRQGGRSGAPTPPPGTPAGSDPAASPGSPEAGA